MHIATNERRWADGIGSMQDLRSQSGLWKRAVEADGANQVLRMEKDCYRVPALKDFYAAVSDLDFAEAGRKLEWLREIHERGSSGLLTDTNNQGFRSGTATDQKIWDDLISFADDILLSLVTIVQKKGPEKAREIASKHRGLLREIKLFQ